MFALNDLHWRITTFDYIFNFFFYFLNLHVCRISFHKILCNNSFNFHATRQNANATTINVPSFIPSIFIELQNHRMPWDRIKGTLKII